MNIKSHTIVGYMFQADQFCGRCIGGQLPTGPGESFDGWASTPSVMLTPEENLNEVAAAFGIDRGDESSFDSDEFPKVIRADQVRDDDRCGACGELLIETV